MILVWAGTSGPRIKKDRPRLEHAAGPNAPLIPVRTKGIAPMSLPVASAVSIAPDDRGEPRSRGRSARSSVDYVPTEADLESIVAVDLDSFLPRNLPFADWLAERARQTALLDDDRSQWLASRIDELAKQAHF